MRLDHELTERIHQRICEALRMGASYELAARYAGIEMKWFWRWKKEGENHQATLNERYRQQCMAFCQDIQQARADYEYTCLLKMERLGSKSFKPLHWKFSQLMALRSKGWDKDNEKTQKTKRTKKIKKSRSGCHVNQSNSAKED